MAIAFLGTLASANAQSGMTLAVKINPEKPDVGESISVIISATNESALPTSINSAKIISPQWQVSSQPTFPVTIGSNETKAFALGLMVPREASGGTNNIVIQLETSAGAMVVSSSVDVQKLQVLPLSGDIPLSILAIVLSGLLSYVIIVYGFTKTFDRSYLELGLASAALGILNWGIYGILTDRTLDEVARSSPSDYLAVTGISIGVGLAIVFIIQYGLTIQKKITSNSELQQIRSQLALKGYADEQKEAWLLYMKKELDKSKEIGRTYTLRVRVYLRIPDGNSYVEGCVLNYDDKPPYGIYLMPKYSIKCQKQELITALCTLVSTTKAKDSIAEDKPYSKMMQKAFPGDLAAELKKKLEAASAEEFIKILEGLDFSRYAYGTLRRIKGKQLIVGGNSVSFVPGDNIARVDILKYDTQFSCIVEDCGSKEIPIGYDYGESILRVPYDLSNKKTSSSGSKLSYFWD
jgi:hypothetical protein